MPILTPAHASDNSSSGLSFGVWQSCPIEEYALMRRGGIFWMEDFRYATAAASSGTAVNVGACTYMPIYSTGCSVAAGTDANGSIVLTHDGTDNDGVAVAFGANAALLPKVPIALTGSTYNNVWFEMRVKTSQVAAAAGMFAGLVLPSITISATVPIAADGTLADTSMIGFHLPEGDPDSIDAVYRTASATAVTAQADAAAIAADTYVKLGLRYDGRVRKMYWYVNGVNVTPAGVAYNATDFPDNITFAPILATVLGSGTACTYTWDWVAVAVQTEVIAQ